MNWDKKSAIEFIKKNVELIDKDNFKDLYNRLKFDIAPTEEVTFLLIEADINPLLYLNEVPEYYLFRQKEIQSIYIPYNIEMIGRSAFQDCNALFRLSLPKNIKYIGEEAFAECYNLKNVLISGDGVTIGKSAFAKCASLTDLTIGDKVGMIHSSVFKDCSSLKLIKYEGTKEQWKYVSKNPRWRQGSSIEIIRCNDGNIELPKLKS